MLIFYRFVAGRPKTILAMITLITAVFLARLMTEGLPSDHSPRSLIVSDDADARRYQETNALFGDDQVMIVALEAEDVFTPEVIGQLRDLTNGFSAIKGVKQVVSPTSIRTARTEGENVRVERLIPPRTDAARLRTIGDEAVSDQLLVGNLVARDRKMAAINIFLNLTAEHRSEAVLGELRRVAEQYAAPAKVYYAGLPYMEYRNGQHIRRDLAKFAPFTVLLILVTFYLSFKSLRGVLLPLAAVAVGLVWTFGTMSFSGRPFTVISMMVPVVIMAIGSSYVIHVLNEYYIACASAARNPGKIDRTALMVVTLEFIAPAVLVSGSTTMAGFGSLVFTDIVGSHDMGLFSAVGCAATTILALTMVPSWLALLPLPKADPTAISTPSLRVGRLLERMAGWATERRGPILISTILAMAVGLSGARRLQIDSALMNFYPENSEERIGADKIREHLGGAAAFQVIVEGDAPGAMRRAPSIALIERLQSDIRSIEGVDSTFSIADLMKIAGRFSSQPGEPPRGLPADQAAMDTLLDRCLQQGGSDDIPVRVLSPDGSKAQIIVRSHLFGSREMRSALDRIERWGAERLPSGFRLYPTGIFVLLNRTSDHVAKDQAKSLAVALTLIFVMMSSLFQSVRLGLIALLPNLVPIVLFFGFMGWAGIGLNLNTSLVASIVLGLAVDNAAHFIRRYQVCRESSPTWKAAVRESLLLTGRPMIFANATLAVAFAIFALSSFLPMRTGGLLSGVTILACLLADLTLLPVLLTSREARSDPGQALERAA
ncbi:MAG: MMPL family transporter [Acidobacteria bacterium]|nr:MMPL family transporter [Acidobacteriota bacterium]